MISTGNNILNNNNYEKKLTCRGDESRFSGKRPLCPLGGTMLIHPMTLTVLFFITASLFLFIVYLVITRRRQDDETERELRRFIEKLDSVSKARRGDSI